MKKTLMILFISIFFRILLNCQTLNESQIFSSKHWIYNALYQLGMEQKISNFIENSMLPVSELKFYLSHINYEKLSETGKFLYDKAYNFLYQKESLIFVEPFSFNTHFFINPELYYKSSDEISWSFKYKYVDNFLTMPLQFGFTNDFIIETDLFFGKSNYGASRNDNFTNIPYQKGDPEFLFPRMSYGCYSKKFNNWGYGFIIGKEGLSIGKTYLGSVFYNDTFETDGYIQANIYNKVLKYSIDLVQVDYSKYLYLHQLEAKIFNQFKISVMEGTQVVGPLEIRYLNPLMVMHSFSAWNDYVLQNEKDSPYGEINYCAYFGVLFDWVPIKNLRIYGLFAQNELQTYLERQDPKGNLYPDSFGGQLGFEYIIPANNHSFYKLFTEAVYTSPYLYIKHTPQASLYRLRQDNMSADEISTWIGSPFGPDCIAGKIGVEFQKISKFNIGLSYLIECKGQNDFDLFNIKTKKGDKEYYSYYPPVNYVLSSNSNYDENLEKALNLLPSGIVTYKNVISMYGEIIFNDEICLNLKTSYNIIFNNKHFKNNQDTGLEFDFSFKYKIF